MIILSECSAEVLNIKKEINVINDFGLDFKANKTNGHDDLQTKTQEKLLNVTTYVNDYGLNGTLYKGSHIAIGMDIHIKGIFLSFTFE